MKKITVFLNQGGRGVTFFPFEAETAKLEQAYTFKVVQDHFSDSQLCEEAFYALNMNHPSNYNNRSLSVGDVLRVEYDDGNSLFYRYYGVATFGFDKLDNDLVEKTIVEKPKNSLFIA